MFPRNLIHPKLKNFFLFGPRGTGKTTWVREHYPDALYFDLLDQSLYQELLRDPGRFRYRVKAADRRHVVIDEVQRLPALLNEAHRLIEEKKHNLILTGSSARKLRRSGVNLLGGRARQLEMHPLTAKELGSDFDLKKSLHLGHLPEAYTADDPVAYLKSYVGTYLRQEVQQEALVRNLATFSHFLEVAAFSQASVLNVSNVASECGVDRKTAENYFVLLEDLLIGVRLPVFQRRKKRKMTRHRKFFYFDVGVFRTLRRRGPLDPAEQLEGPAVETLVLQELRATNANLDLEYELSFWRTQQKQEVDFVLYGPRGLIAIEVKRSSRFHKSDLKGLKLFQRDYPLAKAMLFNLGDARYAVDDVSIIPMREALGQLPTLLGGG